MCVVLSRLVVIVSGWMWLIVCCMIGLKFCMLRFNWLKLIVCRCMSVVGVIVCGLILIENLVLVFGVSEKCLCVVVISLVVLLLDRKVGVLLF